MNAPARRVTRRSASSPAPSPAEATLTPPRIATPQSFVLDINDIEPYEWNPRKNAAAVASVRNSIQQYGFLVPVVIDQANVLITGHTRIEAAKELGMHEVSAIRAEHLSPEAVAQFRIIDNKVAELAEWDHELLAGEIAKLAEFGLDWTQFGFNQNEIDCLNDLVASDCLEVAELTTTAADAAQRAETVRAPTQTRFVFGEFVFFIPQEQYRAWRDGVRSLHDFDKESIEAEIKRRLGLPEV